MRSPFPHQLKIVAAATVAITLGPWSGLGPAAFAAPPDALSGDCALSAVPDAQCIDHQDPALLAEMRNQERLHPAAQELLEASMKLPLDSGFAGVGYGDGVVNLYYKGPLAADMATAVARARGMAPVAVQPAAYSRAELERVQARITAAVERRHGEIQAIGVAGDGSGLRVERMAPVTAAALRANLARKGVSTISADVLLAGLTLDVPITVAEAPGPISLLYSREDDRSPWNGGAQYETWRGLDQRSAWCTTGFGVVKNGVTYVLTADHCMSLPGGDRAYNGHFGRSSFEEIGPVHQSNWDKDILLINARGSAWIFDGGVNSSYTKTVRSWGYRINGELLCTSGSRSGVICGDKTDPYEYNTYGCDSDGDCFTMHDMARADNVNGQCVGVGGDSGGPVFSLDGTGVRAKGIISSKNSANCRILYFQDMDEIVGSMGWYPYTS